MADKPRTRREVLAGTAGLVAGASLAGQMADAAIKADVKPRPTSKILNHNPKMGYRPLGKTGIRISEVSLGGHGCPRIDAAEARVENRRRVLTRAAELGVNYVDTNMAVECELYGKAIKGMRDRWHIGFADWPQKLTEDYEEKLSVKGMVAQIEARLKAYATDRLDLWRPVGAALATDRTKMVSRRVLDMVVEVFEKVKREGKVLHLGLSAHNPKVVETVLNNYPQFEVVLFPYLLLTKELKGNVVTELAAKKGVGVIAIEPFGAGMIFGLRPKSLNGKVDPKAKTILKKVLAEKAISAVIPGVNQPDQLEVNVKASYERDVAMTPTEQQWLAHYDTTLRAHITPEYEWLHDWMHA